MKIQMKYSAGASSRQQDRIGQRSVQQTELLAVQPGER
jgi:hypothetical protein